MLRGIYTSATGMEAQKDMQEVISDNLANVNTSGFKAAKHTYKSFADNMLVNSDGKEGIGNISRGVEAYTTVFDLRQGPLKPTGNPLDLGINGDGFFGIQRNDGTVAYTRNGHFNVDQNGILINQAGNAVLDEGGAPIYLGNQSITSIQILQNGNITVDGNYITRINTYEFPSNAGITRLEGDNYIPADASVVMVSSQKTSFAQGFLETSNVSSVKAATDMVTVTRGYEANQKALKAQLDTLEMLMQIGGL
jgi:flagellar basal-body rod protein FlgG